MLMQRPWSEQSREEKADTIRRTWTGTATSGTLANAISRLCGERVSRQMVISFYGRNPALAITHPLGNRRRAKQRPDDITVPVVGFTREEAAIYDGMALGLKLEELESDQCCWPVARNYFCAHPTDEGHRYCQHHMIRARGTGDDL